MTGQPAISVFTTTGQIVSVPLQQLAQAHALLSVPRRCDAIDLIQAAVEKYFGISQRQLCGGSRRADRVRARHVGMFLARELTTYSLPEIARRFGKTDHTTVLHAVRKIEAQAAQDAGLQAELELLRAGIAGAPV